MLPINPGKQVLSCCAFQALQLRLVSLLSCKAWFADNATAAGSLCGLYNWWSALSKLGPAYGYNVKPSKSRLIVKAKHHELAKKIFAGCGVGITVEGKRHLGAAIGSPT